MSNLVLNFAYDHKGYMIPSDWVADYIEVFSGCDPIKDWTLETDNSGVTRIQTNVVHDDLRVIYRPSLCFTFEKFKQSNVPAFVAHFEAIKDRVNLLDCLLGEVSDLLKSQGIQREPVKKVQIERLPLAFWLSGYDFPDITTEATSALPISQEQIDHFAALGLPTEPAKASHTCLIERMELTHE